MAHAQTAHSAFLRKRARWRRWAESLLAIDETERATTTARHGHGGSRTSGHGPSGVSGSMDAHSEETSPTDGRPFDTMDDDEAPNVKQQGGGGGRDRNATHEFSSNDFVAASAAWSRFKSEALPEEMAHHELEGALATERRKNPDGGGKLRSNQTTNCT